MASSVPVTGLETLSALPVHLVPCSIGVRRRAARQRTPLPSLAAVSPATTVAAPAPAPSTPPPRTRPSDRAAARQRSGPAPVSAYFTPSPAAAVPAPGGPPAPAAPVTDGAPPPVLEAALRGRRLLGATVPLSGVVLSHGGGGGSSESECWRGVASFDGVTAWNHDAPPSAADPLQRVAQWVGLAGALHAPVAAAHVDARVAANAAADVSAAAAAAAARPADGGAGEPAGG